MPRKKVVLEVEEELLEAFTNIRQALDHDELEETLRVLIRLGTTAVALTSIENPIVRLYTRRDGKGHNPVTACPECKHEFIPHHDRDDGFKEAAVTLT